MKTIKRLISLLHRELKLWAEALSQVK